MRFVSVFPMILLAPSAAITHLAASAFEKCQTEVLPSQPRGCIWANRISTYFLDESALLIISELFFVLFLCFDIDPELEVIRHVISMNAFAENETQRVVVPWIVPSEFDRPPERMCSLKGCQVIVISNHLEQIPFVSTKEEIHKVSEEDHHEIE